jgi:hypothetical protein
MVRNVILVKLTAEQDAAEVTARLAPMAEQIARAQFYWPDG